MLVFLGQTEDFSPNTNPWYFKNSRPSLQFELKHLKISQARKKIQIQQITKKSVAVLGDVGEFLLLFREIEVYDNFPKQFRNSSSSPRFKITICLWFIGAWGSNFNGLQWFSRICCWARNLLSGVCHVNRACGKGSQQVRNVELPNSWAEQSAALAR